MPSSLGLNLERTSECRACRQFTLPSMKVVLTLCYSALFSPVPAHTEREYLSRGSKKGLKSAKTALMVVRGNGLRPTDATSAAPSVLQSPSAEVKCHTESATRYEPTDEHAALTRALLAFSIPGTTATASVSQCLLAEEGAPPPPQAACAFHQGWRCDA